MKFRDLIEDLSEGYTDPKKFIEKWAKQDTIEKDLEKMEYKQVRSINKYAEFMRENSKHVAKYPEYAEVYDKIMEVAPGILSKLKKKDDQERLKKAQKQAQELKDKITEQDWETFEKMLKNHDWSYQYSDDHREWTKGRDESRAIQLKLDILKQVNNKRAMKLYNKYQKG